MLCDFCDRVLPAGGLTAFPCADYVRTVLVFEDLTMVVGLCDCHTPFADADLARAVQSIHENVIGAWAACPECARLVRNGDANGLVDRAVAADVGKRLAELPLRSAPLPDELWTELTIPPVEGLPPGDAAMAVRAMHIGYWWHRIDRPPTRGVS